MQKTVLKPRTETALLSDADPLCKLLRQTIRGRPFPLLQRHTALCPALLPDFNSFLYDASQSHLHHPTVSPFPRPIQQWQGSWYFPCMIESKASFLCKKRGLTHQASWNPACNTLKARLCVKRGRDAGSCLLFWNVRGGGEEGHQRGWGGMARGRELGACACQPDTDGELTLRIALGAEMWKMTGAHVALNPALSLQAEQ